MVAMIVALMSGIAPVDAQDGTEPIVQEIQIKYRGAKTVDESRIRANMLTKVGDPLSTEIVEEDIKALYVAGMDDVKVFEEDVPGGVRLIVEVEAQPGLGEIVFLGNSGIKTKDLRKRLELEIGDAVQDFSMQSAEADLEEYYREKGYPDVDITYRVEKSPETGFSRVVFLVDEGIKALLNDVRFEGNVNLTDRQLKKQLESAKFSWGKLFGKGKQVDNDMVELDKGKIENHYRDFGFINAQVVEVRREPVGDGSKGKVDLTFVIDEGELFYVSSINIVGNTVYTVEELMPAIQLKVGEPYSQKKMRTDEKTITQKYYGARGYDSASMTTRFETAAGNQLMVVYDIREQGKSIIRKINIEGNVLTADEVVRRELRVVPGEELNTLKLDASRRALESLGYFQNPSGVDITTSETGIEGVKDVNVNLIEQSTGMVDFRLGFSSIDNLFGVVQVTQRNFDLWNPWSFRGGGQKFNARVLFGTERRDFTMSLVEPWFMDRKLALSSDIYYRDLLYLSDDYEQREIGAAIGLRTELGTNSWVKAEYRLQQIEIHNIDQDASEAIKSEEGEYLESLISLTHNYDTRDSVFLSRRGHRINTNLSFSGLGGDVETWGLKVDAEKHWNGPMDSIFTLEGAVAAVDSYGDDDVPIFNRLTLGGAHSLRGFDYRDVGPKDENGEPLGGLTSAYLTAQVSVPVVGQHRLRLFYDVGFVNEDSFDFSTSGYNSNVGIGAMIYMPILGGPMILDVGFPLEADEHNDDDYKFNFTIGYQF